MDENEKRQRVQKADSISRCYMHTFCEQKGLKCYDDTERCAWDVKIQKGDNMYGVELKWRTPKYANPYYETLQMDKVKYDALLKYAVGYFKDVYYVTFTGNLMFVYRFCTCKRILERDGTNFKASREVTVDEKSEVVSKEIIWLPKTEADAVYKYAYNYALRKSEWQKVAEE